MTWGEIAFVPDIAATRSALEAWRWMMPQPGQPFLCSMFGDLFIEQTDGIWRLDTGAAELERIFPSRQAFDDFLGGDRGQAWQDAVDAWFLPPFVERLHAAGKRANAGQCYGMTILPVFEGGAYTVENAFVVSLREWLIYTGDVHRQLRDVPEGGQVRIKVTD